jgi:hypothetical protein
MRRANSSDLSDMQFQPAKEDVIPLRRTRTANATKSTAKRTTTYRKSLETEIGGWLSVLNFGFLFLPAPYSADVLDSAEIEVLAKQINKVAQKNATVYKYLSYVLSGGGSTFDLALTVGIITGRRLARHGVIAAEYDFTLAQMLQRLGASQESMEELSGESEPFFGTPTDVSEPAENKAYTG